MRKNGSKRSKESVPSESPKQENFVRHQYEPKNKGQKVLVNSIRYNDVTFAMGPPGVGKTIAAISLGCEYLLDGTFKRIILTRPTVFQGKGIGFLPGNIEEKMNPYMIPMYEVIKKYFTPTELATIYNIGTSSYRQSPRIEIVPFDFMRGRNWYEGDYVVLDEAQNATYEQVYTILTRMCSGSKLVTCGDLSQRDIFIERGIEVFIKKLKHIPGIGCVELTEQDIVRHPLVGEMIKALKE